MDSTKTTKIVLQSKEYEIPSGVTLVDGDLYSIPFGLISVAESDLEESAGTQYQWSNPRYFGQAEGSLGSGFSKEDMDELADSIKEEGLLCPLICRWKTDSGELEVEILDGERRWRSVDRLIKKNEKVWSRAEKKWLSAKQVFDTVLCTITTGNDKEALRVAFAVSDRAVGWGDGATAKLVKKLRKCKCNDEEILEITKKTPPWLKEMDQICALDELTFSYLIGAKINRALALRLSKIKDLKSRHHWLHACYEDAVVHQKEIYAQAEMELEKAELKEELAEATLAEVKFNNDEESVAEAEQELAEAVNRVEEKQQKKKKASRPIAKTKNLDRVASEEGEGDLVKPLSPRKIKLQLKSINTLIQSDGKNDDVEVDLPVLYGIQACYNAILKGEDDVLPVLKRYTKAMDVMEKRK